MVLSFDVDFDFLFVLIRSRYVMRYVICFPCTHIYRLYTAYRQGPSESENIMTVDHQNIMIHGSKNGSKRKYYYLGL